MTDLMKNVNDAWIGYHRTSTKDQDGKAGIFEIHQWTDSRGIRLEELIFDKGYSGRNVDNPGMKRLREIIRSGRKINIVGQKSSRFFRSTAGMQDFMAECKNRGIRVVFIGDGIDTSQDNPMTQAFWKMLSVFNEFECEIIRERVMAGHSAAKANGKHIGRPKGSGDKRKRSVSGYCLRYAGTTPEQRKLGSRKIA